jgi:glutamate--cysteine ligase
VRELARRLVEVAGEGLRRIGAAGALDPDERGLLEPVRAQLALGKSPGEVILERWEGEWNRSPARLIDYARY